MWADEPYCHAPGKKDGYCKSNQALSIHHIDHRISSSTLNGILLCEKCHRNYTFLDKSELFKIVIRYLVKIGYQFTIEDILFKRKYEKYYE